MERVMDMGQRLKELREAQQLTQEQLARRANLSSNTLSKMETGARQVSGPEVLVLSQALHISPNQFYGIESLPPRKPCVKDRKVQRLVRQLKKTTDNLVATVEAS